MENKESVVSTIGKACMKIKNDLAKELKPYRVTSEQLVLLSKLWHQDGISQKELAKKCLKDQPTTTRILDKLEVRGLITRQINLEDKRAFMIYLTDEAKELRIPLITVASRHMGKALIGVSKEEQAQLKVLLNKIINNLD